MQIKSIHSFTSFSAVVWEKVPKVADVIVKGKVISWRLENFGRCVYTLQYCLLWIADLAYNPTYTRWLRHRYKQSRWN